MIPSSNFRLQHVLNDHARKIPNAVGWIDDVGSEFTFGDMKDRVDAKIGWLADKGLNPGDRVMLIAENCVELIECMLAVWHFDAWIVPVNARMSDGEVDRISDHSKPKLILFTTQVSKDAAAHAKRLNAKTDDGLTFVLDSHSKSEPASADSTEQVAALIYTTGTTGNPKGVMLSHANIGWYANLTKEIRGYSPGQHTYCALPITHVFGMGNVFLGNLFGGGTLELAARFDAAEMMGAIERGATVLPAVPAMYAHFLNHATSLGMSQLKKNKLRYIMTGGAPLDADWKVRVEEFFNLPLQNGYGMTECSPGISSTLHADTTASGGDVSCGPVLEGLDVKIGVPTQKTDTDDGVGEILVKGPNVMLGYYKNPQASAEAFTEDGYFRTGDLGYFTKEKNLVLSGRSKELIIRSGFNVYPPEVEAVLSQHVDVTLAAVVGRKEAGGNEEVLAFVQLVPGKHISEAELKDAITNDLAPYKRPSRIIISPQLPVSATGKVLKSRLIDEYAEQLN